MLTLNALTQIKIDYRRLITEALILILLLGQTGAEKEIVVPSIGDQICISGYIMDTYCIDLGKWHQVACLESVLTLSF